MAVAVDHSSGSLLGEHSVKGNSKESTTTPVRSLGLLLATMVPAVAVGYGIAHLIGTAAGNPAIHQMATGCTVLSSLSGIAVVNYYAVRKSPKGALIYGTMFTAMIALASAFTVG